MKGHVMVGKKGSGFTLVELMVVFALIGILAVVAVPNFSVWVANYRLKQAARDVVSRLQLAKLTAIKRNTNCAITFNQTVGGSTYDYVVFIDVDEDLEHDATEEVLNQVLWSDYGSISFDTSQGGGDGLTFSPNDDGYPANAFTSRGFSTNNAGAPGMGAIFLKNTNNKAAKVVVSAAGNIGIE
jgi:prepilin-type N-terminal cleavage/methylation domain-containing protein